MHNGGIGGFQLIKRKMHNCMSDQIFRLLTGSTDSEHAFMLFLEQLEDPLAEYSKETIADALQAVILKIMLLQKDCKVEETVAYSSLNFAVSDGIHTVTTRCRTAPRQDPPSLYYIQGSSFALEGNTLHMRSDPGIPQRTLITCSEPLTIADEKHDHWRLMEKDSMLISELNSETITIVPLNLHTNSPEQLAEICKFFYDCSNKEERRFRVPVPPNSTSTPQPQSPSKSPSPRSRFRSEDVPTLN
jgi:glutamine amidotransferase